MIAEFDLARFSAQLGCPEDGPDGSHAYDQYPKAAVQFQFSACSADNLSPGRVEDVGHDSGRGH